MTDTPATRFSLVGRLHDSRDSDAWVEFVQIYQPMIFRIAQSRGLQHADAAEVAQEVLTRVAGAIGGWNPSPENGTFRGWLYRITRNLTVDFLRKNGAPEMRRDSDTNFDLAQIPEPAVDESREFHFEYERQLFNWAASIVQPQFKRSNWQAFLVDYCWWAFDQTGGCSTQTENWDRLCRAVKSDGQDCFAACHANGRNDQ